MFTICFWLFVALSLLIFLASELLAPSNLLPYSFSLLPWSLNIPPDRFHTAQIVYQFSILVMVAKTMQILYFYCRAHFAEGHLISPHLALRTSHLLSSLTGFFSWSILGAIANMLKQQGLNVLLNLFFGVAFNATWAVANKIGMAVNQLVGNFQQAFNPHCRVPLLICRERDVLTRFPRQFCAADYFASRECRLLTEYKIFGII